MQEWSTVWVKSSTTCALRRRTYHSRRAYPALLASLGRLAASAQAALRFSRAIYRTPRTGGPWIRLRRPAAECRNAVRRSCARPSWLSERSIISFIPPVHRLYCLLRSRFVPYFYIFIMRSRAYARAALQKSAPRSTDSVCLLAALYLPPSLPCPSLASLLYLASFVSRNPPLTY